MKHALDVVYCCFFFTHSWISHELSNFQRFLILFGFFSLKAIFFYLQLIKVMDLIVIKRTCYSDSFPPFQNRETLPALIESELSHIPCFHCHAIKTTNLCNNYAHSPQKAMDKVHESPTQRPQTSKNTCHAKTGYTKSIYATFVSCYCMKFFYQVRARYYCCVICDVTLDFLLALYSIDAQATYCVWQ